MPYALTWLADVLHAAGCKVIEENGWKAAGNGDMGTVKGVLLHHTASPAGSGDHPSLKLVRDGRPPSDPWPLDGPLSHLLLSRDGTFHVLAAGRCNHAGAGQWHGVTAGNSSFIGIEAENAGTGKEAWPQAQMAAYIAGVTALLKHIRADSVMAVGHKEYALPRGRKIDPAFDMVDFRQHVENTMELGFSTALRATVTAVDPTRAMLAKGDQGTSVKLLQQILRLNDDGGFGPKTEAAVKAFQTAHGLLVDGKVGPKTWTALLAKNPAS